MIGHLYFPLLHPLLPQLLQLSLYLIAHHKLALVKLVFHLQKLQLSHESKDEALHVI